MVPENYAVHVPKGTGNQLSAAMQMIPADSLDSWRMHRVAAGETLSAIAKRYGVTSTNIVSANRMESPEAQEGDRLLIPSMQRIQTAAPAAAAKSKSKKTVTASAKRKSGSTPRRTTTVSANRKSPTRSALMARNSSTN